MFGGTFTGLAGTSVPSVGVAVAAAAPVGVGGSTGVSVGGGSGVSVGAGVGVGRGADLDGSMLSMNQSVTVGRPGTRPRDRSWEFHGRADQPGRDAGTSGSAVPLARRS